MKKTLLGFAVVFLFTGSLTGCALMLGSEKSVRLSTNPADSTAIVYDRNGTVIDTVTTPTSISFERPGNYSIEINKSGYLPRTISIKSKFNHSFWFNFLVSGIGVSSVLAFDPNFTFQPDNYFAIAGYGLSILGVVGVFVDIFSGSLVGVTPERVNINLDFSPETLARQEAVRQGAAEARQAQIAAEEARQREIEETRRVALINRSQTRSFSELNLSTNAQRAEYLKISERDFTVLAEAIGGNISQLSPKTFVDRAKVLQNEAHRIWMQYMAMYPTWQSAVTAFYYQRPDQGRIFDTEAF